MTSLPIFLNLYKLHRLILIFLKKLFYAQCDHIVKITIFSGLLISKLYLL